MSNWLHPRIQVQAENKAVMHKWHNLQEHNTNTHKEGRQDSELNVWLKKTRILSISEVLRVSKILSYLNRVKKGRIASICAWGILNWHQSWILVGGFQFVVELRHCRVTLILPIFLYQTLHKHKIQYFLQMGVEGMQQLLKRNNINSVKQNKM